MAAIDSLKLAKTCGLSGVSNEFLKEMATIPVGRDLLLEHLTTIYLSGELPSSFCEAYVCLIPKVGKVESEKQFRPICLLESLHKLYCCILIRRLQIPNARVQFGGLKGGQTMDALAAAHQCMAREVMSKRYSVWVSLDVAAAFDSLSHETLGKYLCQCSTEGPLAFAALRLFQPGPYFRLSTVKRVPFGSGLRVFRGLGLRV